jgi:hypothetical protein
MVYFAITVLIIPTAFLVICLLTMLVVCCPCITWAIVRAVLDERERGLLKERVIEQLSKISFDPNKFRHQKTCSICLVDFI